MLDLDRNPMRFDALLRASACRTTSSTSTDRLENQMIRCSMWARATTSIFAITALGIVAGCVSKGRSAAEESSLSEYLRLSEEDRSWLRGLGERGVYERAESTRLGGFDIFTESDGFRGKRKLYVARDGAILAIIDSDPGTAEIYDGRTLPFEFMARVSANLSSRQITYRGDGITVEDRGWNGPDLIYANQSGRAQEWSYVEGGEVRFPSIRSNCVQALPKIERIACCPGQDAQWEAWSFQLTEGWRKADEETPAARTCRQLGVVSPPDGSLELRSIDDKAR